MEMTKKQRRHKVTHAIRDVLRLSIQHEHQFTTRSYPNFVDNRCNTVRSSEYSLVNDNLVSRVQEVSSSKIDVNETCDFLCRRSKDFSDTCAPQSVASNYMISLASTLSQNSYYESIHGKEDPLDLTKSINRNSKAWNFSVEDDSFFQDIEFTLGPDHLYDAETFNFNNFSRRL